MIGVKSVAPGEALRGAGRAIAGDRRFAVRGALVVAQIAISFVLVIAAGLFLRTFTSLSQLPLGFVVRKRGAQRPTGVLEAELVAAVRERIGPVAAFKRVCVVEKLPKTRSGKVLRGTMRRIADGEPWRAPPTIEDASALDEISAALARLAESER